ncbi:MAG: hypothetical protein L0Z48_05785 [candidate division Zixibacteria bacterium]|nr:hypothetical protein [candidate division Zixibacteria bacterium]MCI0596034.1 hypothetical protein [candidate division Zixibacteria bacterium]
MGEAKLEYFLLFSRSLAWPVPLLLGIALFSTWLEGKFPFGNELKNADGKAVWGEGLFRFLWCLLFFDLIPAALYFQFRPEFFSSPLVTALAATAVTFVLGFLPLTILLGSRYNFDWGYLFFTLLWIYAAMSASLWGIQKAYRI